VDDQLQEADGPAARPSGRREKKQRAGADTPGDEQPDGGQTDHGEAVPPSRVSASPFAPTAGSGRADCTVVNKDLSLLSLLKRRRAAGLTVTAAQLSAEQSALSSHRQSPRQNTADTATASPTPVTAVPAVLVSAAPTHSTGGMLEAPQPVGLAPRNSAQNTASETGSADDAAPGPDPSRGEPASCSDSPTSRRMAESTAPVGNAERVDAPWRPSRRPTGPQGLRTDSGGLLNMEAPPPLMVRFNDRPVTIHSPTERTQRAVRRSAKPAAPTGVLRTEFWQRVIDGPSKWHEDRWYAAHEDSPQSARSTGGTASQKEAAAATAGARHKARAKQLRPDCDPSTLPFVLPAPKPTGKWSSNRKKPETVAELKSRSEIPAYTSPTTDHVVVFWYETAQLARARAAGVDMTKRTAMGPSPYLDIDGEYSKKYNLKSAATGPQRPRSVTDLFKNPKTWLTVTNWFDQYTAEIQRVEKSIQRIIGGDSKQSGHEFNAARVPGGRDGVEIEQTTMKEGYAHLVWDLSELRPQAVREELPDSNTTIELNKIYQQAVTHGLADMEIASMLPLYGIRSNTAMSSKTVLLPNYKAAWENLDTLQEAWRSMRHDFGRFPRASAARRQPHHFPCRVLPKGCVVQIKDTGKIKKRQTTDGGARRRRREAHRQRTRDRIDTLVQRIETLGPSKAPAGEDSPNGAMDLDALASFKWGDFVAFGNNIDMLAASGEAIDVIATDFEGYYHQYPRARSEHWWHEEVVQSQGATVATRGTFGVGDLPNFCNRTAFLVQELITLRLDEEQRKLPMGIIPEHVRQWVKQRHAAGLSTSFTTQMVFFDDCSMACLSLGGRWTEIVLRTAKAVWAEFKMDLAHDKTQVSRFGDGTEAVILGVAFDVAQRQRRLPAAKQQKYSDNVDAVLAAAAEHPNQLVTKLSVQQVLGRLLFAMAAAVPRMWTKFLRMLASISSDWSDFHMVKLHAEAQQHLRDMRHMLWHHNGTWLTPYRLRPHTDTDSRPVIVSYTDAGLQGEHPQHTGAGFGGLLFQHRADTPSYTGNTVWAFHGTWDIDAVNAAGLDVNELETLSAEYAAELADDHRSAILGAEDTEEYYLYQIGDSAVHFHHVAETGKAAASGLRFLADRREQAEWDSQRLTTSLHVTREFNVAADRLAAGDLAAFRTEIRHLLGEVQIQFVDIRGQQSFNDLVAFRRRRQTRRRPVV
jgi:hypothetical protein